MESSLKTLKGVMKFGTLIGGFPLTFRNDGFVFLKLQGIIVAF